MKPRYEETSQDVQEMLTKAISFEKRLDELEKAECPTCGMKKMDCMKKYGSTSACMKKYGAANMKKGEHHKATSFGTKPEMAQFHIETGGNTYHQGYQTNQSLLEVDDIANKGARSASVNLDALAREQNTHDKNTGHFSFAGE